MLAIVLVIGGQAVYSSRQQSAAIQRMYELELKGVSNIKQASIHLMEVGRALRQMILSNNDRDRAAADESLDRARVELNRGLAENDRLLFRPEARRMLADVGGMMSQYLRNVDHVTDLLARAGNSPSNEITHFLASADNVRIFEHTDKLMEALVGHEEAAAGQAAQEAVAYSQLIETRLIWLLGAGVAIGLATGLLLGASLRRPSERLRGSIEGLSQGKLHLEVPHTDFENEIGDMARALAVLQAGAREAEAQRWSKTLANSLGARIQMAESLHEFARVLLAELTPRLNMQLGLLYVYDKATGRSQSATRPCSTKSCP